MTARQWNSLSEWLVIRILENTADRPPTQLLLYTVQGLLAPLKEEASLSHVCEAWQGAKQGFIYVWFISEKERERERERDALCTALKLWFEYRKFC